MSPRCPLAHMYDHCGECEDYTQPCHPKHISKEYYYPECKTCRYRDGHWNKPCFHGKCKPSCWEEEKK